MNNRVSTKSARVFLGIDPGTTIIGYGLVRDNKVRLLCEAYGVIDGSGLDKLGQFKKVRRELVALIKKHSPLAVAVEKLFFFKNQKTVMSVSEMRGVILSVLSELNIPIYELTPLQVKQKICNYGRAEKKQVQSMVKMLLHLKHDVKPDDAADALALAMCCSTMIGK